MGQLAETTQVSHLRHLGPREALGSVCAYRWLDKEGSRCQGRAQQAPVNGPSCRKPLSINSSP